MKKFEELTLEDVKALYEEKVKQETIKQEEPKEEKPIRWRAEDDKHYWYVGNDGCVRASVDIDYDDDKYNYSIGNYFETRGEAEEYKKKLILQQQYKDWCRFNCDWNNGSQEKYFVNYYYTKICINYTLIKKEANVIYAQSKERIQEFIDKIGEENFKKYILELEE